MRLILGILACVLFPCGFFISEYFFSDQNLRWHLLRAGLFSVNIALAGAAYLFPVNLKYEGCFKVSIYTLIGMITGDFLDKTYAIYYNVEDRFILIDVLFTILALALGIKKYVYVGIRSKVVK